MSEFLHMGGYAFYVWTAYGAALAVLALNLAAPIVRRRRLIHERVGAAPPAAATDGTPPSPDPSPSPTTPPPARPPSSPPSP